MTTKKPTKGAPAKRRGSPTILAGITLSDQLIGLGLAANQADLLVKDLSAIRYDLRERRKRQHSGQTLGAQRKALEAMRNAASDVIASFSKASNLIDPAGLGMVLRRRLDEASNKDAGQVVNELLDSAHAAQWIVRSALQALPTSQTRDRVSTLPIRLVHERTGLPPSTSATSRFRDIVLALYGAAGFPEQNPDAAIRAYLATLKD